MSKHEYLTVVGRSVKSQRVEHHYSLPALAESARISKGNLFKIESGRGNATVGTLLKLAKTMNCDVKDFLP